MYKQQSHFSVFSGSGLGGQLLGLLGISAGGTDSMDIGNIIGNIAGVGVGGGVLIAIVSHIKNAMKKK
jgi:hypothetical protein